MQKNNLNNSKEFRIINILERLDCINPLIVVITDDGILLSAVFIYGMEDS